MRENQPLYSEAPEQDFMNYLLHETNPAYKNVVLSHNGGRYDVILMCKSVYGEQHLGAKMIARGNKIFQLKTFDTRQKKSQKRCKRGTMTTTEFHDTYNIIPIRLDQMVKTLDLKNAKGDGPLQQKGSFLKKQFIYFLRRFSIRIFAT